MVTRLAQQDFVTHLVERFVLGGSVMLAKRPSDLQPTIRQLRSDTGST
jgi:hypothetical protein